MRCDRGGAFIGDVPLLEYRRNEWVARDPDSLSDALSRAYGLPVDTASKCEGLAALARALNRGDIALAQATTLFLQFPDPLSLAKRTPSRDETVGLVRALHLSGLLKIDDRHYPAKTPDDKGGQFAPKYGPLNPNSGDDSGSDPTDVRQLLSEQPKEPEPSGQSQESTALPEPPAADRDMVGSGALSQVEERVAESVERKVAAAAIRRFARRAIRAAALEALKKSYKLLLDEIPIVGIASDISTIRDVIQLGKEFESVRITARAAKDFVDLGPRRVQDLYVDDQVQSFPSYPDFVKADASRFAENELEKRYGAAGPGMHYHHIIERGSGLPETITESTDNIVRIPEVLHDEINARYAIKDARWGGMSLREWLKKKSPWVQRYWGERIMREMGMIR